MIELTQTCSTHGGDGLVFMQDVVAPPALRGADIASGTDAVGDLGAYHVPHLAGNWSVHRGH
jgi:hypothetical protein